MSNRRSVGFALLLALCLWPAASRGAYPRTFSFLTTGNGHGFQVYDINQRKIITFLEHPYRYLSPNPSDPKADGIGRRNLAYDFYFGVRGSSSGWLNQATPSGDPAYLDGTNIVRAAFTQGTIQAETYYFAPFGYEGNAMVALMKAPGASDGLALLNFHMGSGGSRDAPDAGGESVRAASDGSSLVETGPGGGAMVYVPLSGADKTDCVGVFGKIGGGLGSQTSCSGNDIVPAFQKGLSGSGGWMAVAVLYTDNAGEADSLAQKIKTWANGRTPEQLLNDAKAEWDAWRKPPPAGVNLSPDEARLWRQSEVVLRMGQIREPVTGSRKNNGMILASLPPGEWHTGWVRDAMYAVVALARSGHYEESRMALDFFLGAAPVGKYKSYVSNQDYRISVVRYFGNGEEEADYSGQPSPNVETDGWGMLMWAARQYVDASKDVAWLNGTTRLGSNVYDAIANGVAKPLSANLEPNGLVKPDSSIWEVHDDNKKHFTYTSLAATRGFCDMATLAKRLDKAADVKTYQDLSDHVYSGLFKSVLDRQGAIAGSVEGLEQNKYLDAAVVESFTWNIVTDYQSTMAKATLDLLKRLLVASGGYKRNDNGKDDYDNNEWILIDLRMSDALRRAGRTDEANALLSLVVDKAAVNGFLVPELYNAVNSGAIGSYAGSIPMVGYGAGAFILTVLDRAGLIEPNDCGRSIVTDGGTIQVTDGGSTRPPIDTPGGGNNAYTSACLCQAGPGGAAAGIGSGTAAVLGLPWLLLGLRLSRRGGRRSRS